MAGLVGWAVDAATGSIMKYDRKSYDIELEAKKDLSNLQPDMIDIDTKNHTLDLYVFNDK